MLTLVELATLLAFGAIVAHQSIAKSATQQVVEMTKTKNQIRSQFEELESILNSTIKKQSNIITPRIDPNTERNRLQATISSQEELIKQLETRINSANGINQKLTQQIDALKRNSEELQARASLGKICLERHSSEAAENEEKIRDRQEYVVRRELTGLPDRPLNRVLFLVDTSASMRRSSSWSAARNLVKNWLQFFPVQECALVSFNDRAEGFPHRKYLRVRNSDGSEIPKERDLFVQKFDQSPMGTGTDLLSGLKMAYSQYEAPDIIVVFSDGAPRTQCSSSRKMMDHCILEAQKHAHIPILCVALGSYEIDDSEEIRSWLESPGTGQLLRQESIPPRVEFITRRSKRSVQFDTRDTVLDQLLHRSLIMG